MDRVATTSIQLLSPNYLLISPNMVKSDTTNRYNGLIQRCEDDCGLGATGITSNTNLYSMFVGWLNEGNKYAASIAIMSWDGADFDDKGYSTTQPHGYFSARSTARDYNYDSAYKVLKQKLCNVTYDGVNWQPAKVMDADDYRDYALNDALIDQYFPIDKPVIDLRAQGFELYPKHTAAQVTLLNSLLPDGSGGNKGIYVEWDRAPRDFDTTSGTDLYEPAVDLQFHHFPALYASYKYCSIYKPDRAIRLSLDLYGNGGNIPGLKKEMEQWYNAKSPSNANITIKRRVLR